MRIHEIYTPRANTEHAKMFYLQFLTSDCVPGTFGCDLGTHWGYIDDAKKQAQQFQRLTGRAVKIVDKDGKVLEVIS